VQAWSAFGGGRHGDWARARSWRRLPSSMHAHDAVGLHSSEERVGKWKPGALACGRGYASAATVGERGWASAAIAQARWRLGEGAARWAARPGGDALGLGGRDCWAAVGRASCWAGGCAGGPGLGKGLWAFSFMLLFFSLSISFFSFYLNLVLVLNSKYTMPYESR
jgi:hypothetical protein